MSPHAVTTRDSNGHHLLSAYESGTFLSALCIGSVLNESSTVTLIWGIAEKYKGEREAEGSSSPPKNPGRRCKPEKSEATFLNPALQSVEGGGFRLGVTSEAELLTILLHC